MAVTAEAVKILRERTGAGMMECKKALVEANGDLDAAAELMRKSGLAKADKKASRVAAEGVIVLERSADGKRAASSRSTPRPTSSRARTTSRTSPARSPRWRWNSVRPTSPRCWRSGHSGRPVRVEEDAPRADRQIGENIGVRRFELVEAPAVVGATCTARASVRWWSMKSGDEALAQGHRDARRRHQPGARHGRGSAGRRSRQGKARFHRAGRADPKNAGKPRELVWKRSSRARSASA